LKKIKKKALAAAAPP